MNDYNPYNPYNPYSVGFNPYSLCSTPINFNTSSNSGAYENAIRSSNTIFSTMVCPECGERLIFERNDTSSSFTAYCPTRSHYSVDITFDEMCGILNHNGLNKFVTPYIKSTKELEENISELKRRIDKEPNIPPPPDGLKIEPLGDE